MNIFTLSPRILSALRYLSWADPVYKWRIHQAPCPLCGKSAFVILKAAAFMTRCLRCHANATNLSLIPVIQRHAQHNSINTVWEMSTYGATLDYLKANVDTVYESEYSPELRSGAERAGILNQDVQNLSFADSSLDLISSNQVFEHVADDIQGYRECYRALKNGGALIFSVPLYDLPATQQLAEIHNHTIRFNSEPEYHDSRLAGPRSALTFWRHSFHDICERVANAGFDTQLVEVSIPTERHPSSYVIYARKQ